ncbi:MAG: discoidin domain-containing protein, partial [Verrucomicrobiota bacterium]|nr:discoidin domain-containing protein [Verrucomicrobiota bacterium]
MRVPALRHWVLTASASVDGYGPGQAVDGQTNTWWRSGESEPQWIQVDMGRTAMVGGFSLQWGDPPAVSYTISTSLDGVHWAMAHDVSNGDGGWDQVRLEAAPARYIRVLVRRGRQGTGASLVSLEVLGLWDQPVVTVDGDRRPEAAVMLDGPADTVWASSSRSAVLLV